MSDRKELFDKKGWCTVAGTKKVICPIKIATCVETSFELISLIARFLDAAVCEFGEKTRVEEAHYHTRIDYRYEIGSFVITYTVGHTDFGGCDLHVRYSPKNSAERTVLAIESYNPSMKALDVHDTTEISVFDSGQDWLSEFFQNMAIVRDRFESKMETLEWKLKWLQENKEKGDALLKKMKQ